MIYQSLPPLLFTVHRGGGTNKFNLFFHFISFSFQFRNIELATQYFVTLMCR